MDAGELPHCARTVLAQRRDDILPLDGEGDRQRLDVRVCRVEARPQEMLRAFVTPDETVGALTLRRKTNQRPVEDAAQHRWIAKDHEAQRAGELLVVDPGERNASAAIPTVGRARVALELVGIETEWPHPQLLERERLGPCETRLRRALEPRQQQLRTFVLHRPEDTVQRWSCRARRRPRLTSHPARMRYRSPGLNACPPSRTERSSNEHGRPTR